MAVVSGLLMSPAQAGRYPSSVSQGFTYADGTVPGVGGWNDGSALASSMVGEPPAPVASVRNNALRLTLDGQTNTAAAFRLPDVDPGLDVTSLTISFSLKVSAAGTAGGGLSVNFGNLPPEGLGDGELGWPLPGGMTVGFETSGPQSAGQIQGAVVVYSNNVVINRFPVTFANDALFRPAVVRFDAQGLDVRWNEIDLVVNLAVPGFAPSVGHRTGFSARTTAEGSQELALDAVSVVTVAATTIATGGPVISEFMAANTGSHEDEDLATSDWIEILNGSAASVPMAGWSLTTDPTHQLRWVFPAVSMAANSYRVVFASGKNRSPVTSAGQLHTNFSLQRESGYLALLRPDLTVASEFSYGQQFNDVSHGEIGASRVRGYLETPTPGTKNISIIGDGAPAEEVIFSRTGGIIPPGTTVTLSITPPSAPGAVVRYSLAQSLPTEISPAYAEPFSITNATTIRARVFAPGRLPGPVSSRTFLRLDSSLSNFVGSGQVFHSNLPIVVLDSHGVNVDATTDPNSNRPYRPTFGVVIAPDPITGRARLDGPADFQGRGGTHVRGESSSGFNQKSYSWEIWDNRNLDKDESILGLPAESDFALIAPWSDKSMLRNYLVFSCFDDLRSDWVSPRTRFVEVFFNQEAGTPGQVIGNNDYRGCYLLVERIKRSSNRLDLARINPLVTDPSLITGGYVFKTDKANPGPTAWTTSRGISIQSSDPNVFSTAQQAYLQKYLNDYESVLHNNSTFAHPQTGYAAWIDVPSFIDAQWAVEIPKQIDGYVFSTYYHKDRGGKVRAGPLWDFNISMGNADYAEGEHPTGWNYDPAPRTAPLAGGLWFGRLQADPNYRVATFDRYWQLRAGPWNTASLMARIDAAVAQLTDGDPTPVVNNSPATLQNPAARQYRKHQILGARQWPNPAIATTLKTYQAEIDYLKQWMTTRLSWMDNGFSIGQSAMRPPALSSVPEGSNGSRVSLSRFGGTVPGFHFPPAVIHYTTDGSDPRPLHYAMPTTQSITPLAEYGSGSWFVPTASNGGSALATSAWTGVAAPSNAGDWTTSTLGIGFDTLTSSNSNPTLYHVGGAHPSNNTWDGGTSNLRSAMHNQSAAAFLRVPFSLTADQRNRMATLTLRMRYDDGFIAFVNGVEVHRQHVNAEVPADWTASANATPTSHTESAAAAVSTFNLSHAIQHLQAGSNMLAIIALNKTAADTDLLCSPSLTAALANRPAAAQPAITAPVYSDPVSLADGGTLKARLFWPEAGMWGPLATSTSAVPSVPAARTNLVVSEIQYNPAPPTAAELAAGGTEASDFEFIEVMNTSSTDTVDLTGVKLTGAVQEFDFSLASPSVRLVPPGGRVVVCGHSAAFSARYGSSAATRLAGVFGGNLNNAGETITLLDAAGAVLWSFAYDDTPPWPTVGGGSSIVLNNPSSIPSPDPAIGSNWRASASPQGKPGAADSVPFGSLDPTADIDGDAVPSLLEYIMGSEPTDAASVAGLIVTWLPGNAPDPASIQLQFPRNLAADGYTLGIESSADLTTWRVESGFTLVHAQRLDSGRQSESWSLPLPPAGAVPLYFRLSAQRR